MDRTKTVLHSLTSPEKLWTRHQLTRRPSLVPRSSGIYAWYFTGMPAFVPVADCHEFDGKRPL
jgi:hypothetical protein